MFYTDDDSNVGNEANDLSNLRQCPHCQRYYETKTKLKAHIQKYCLKEKKYKCFYCVYRSKRRDHIRRHMIRVHANQLNKRVASGLSMEIEATLDESLSTTTIPDAVDPTNLKINSFKDEDDV